MRPGAGRGEGGAGDRVPHPGAAGARRTSHPRAGPPRFPRGWTAATTAATAAAFLVAACWVEPADQAELEQAESGPGLDARVDSALKASADAWNGGDLEGFMSVYLRSPRTTYVGSTGLEVGYDAIRQRYAPLFEAGAERDSLSFEDLRVRSVSDDVAVGTARWVLRDGAEVTGSGPFTLVLRRVDGSWQIVHDHSSSDPDQEDAGPDGETEAPSGGAGDDASGGGAGSG